MMDFVIQYNSLSDRVLTTVKDAVADLPHRFVRLIPFSREITSDEPIAGLDHIPYGSTSFVEETYRRGWRGLSFDIAQFSYDTACANRDDMLNAENILPASDMICFLQTLRDDEDIFIRPAHDLKQFAGSVYSAGDAREFLTDAMTTASSGSYKIDPSLLIVTSEPKNLLVEYRWFVVGGKVIDGSIYRRAGQLKPSHVTDEVLPIAIQALADKWLPAPCCTMDTALLDSGETKVVEFNCINGSGFYDHDIRKVMTHWMRYHND